LAAHLGIAVLVVLYFTPAPALGLGQGPPAVVWATGAAEGPLLAGASKVNITPYTEPGATSGPRTSSPASDPISNPVSNDDPDWTGPVTLSGVWGEIYGDANGNGRYDEGEAFTDDPASTAADPGSAGRWDGIYLAGYDADRVATGVVDPLWVRTIVLRNSPAGGGETGGSPGAGDSNAGQPGLTVAWATLDLIGVNSTRLPRVRAYLAEIAPGLDVDVILLTATHTHQGPDTVGLWGPTLFETGRWELYLDYVDRKVAESIALAAARLTEVEVTYGMVDPAGYPDLSGLQGRMGNRTPVFFDEELRVMGLAGRAAGTQVATLVNWGAHVESFPRESSLISSDAVDAMRLAIEEELGGVAVFTPADTGAVVLRKDNPVTLGTEGLERTRAIGRLLAEGALAALRAGSPDPGATFLEMRSKDIYIPLTNQSFRLGGILGIIDVPLYVADRWQAGSFLGSSVKTTMYAFRLGEGTFTTVPGELFPEINFGVDRHHREDMADVTTGRPFEPSIRDAQPGTYKFLIGYTQDLLGYVVPAYDYRIYGLPFVSGVGLGALMGEVPDPNAAVPPDPSRPDALYKEHYHEITSASSYLGPAVATTAAGLWGQDLTRDPSYREWLGSRSALFLLPNPFAHLHLDFEDPWVEHQ